MIDRNTIEKIIDRAEILEVVGDFVTLRRHGKDYVGHCPFHNDNRPSFSVSPAKNLCKCFACGEGGNPVSFVMKHEQMTFPEAIKYLGRKYGIEVEEKEMTLEQRERITERERLFSANKFALETFVHCLHQDAVGRRIGFSYFKERGLTEETIKRFELGYSPEETTYLAAKAQNSGIPIEIFEQTGLLLKGARGDYIDRYRDRVIYPIHSVSGNIVGFGGRILVKKENTGKYINSPSSPIYDKSKELYGLFFAKKSISQKDKCLVLEGYMDVLSMSQAGVENVVASSGTALTADQVQLIKRYTSNVVLIFDSDAAGVKAALRGLDVCLEHGLRVKVVRLPEGEDPDSFAQNNRLEEIESYLRENETDALHFKAQILEGELGEGPQAKSEVVHQLAESIAYISDELNREVYIRDIAQLMSVSVDALFRKVEELRQKLLYERRRAQIRDEQRLTPQQMAPPPPSSSVSSFADPHTSQEASFSVAPHGESPSVSTERGKRLESYEEHLLYMLLKQGGVVIEDYETAEMSLGARVVDIIGYETEDLKAVQELSPFFIQILETAEGIISQDPNANLPTKLMAQIQDDDLPLILDRLLMQEYPNNSDILSPLHDSYKAQLKGADTILAKVMDEILSFKFSYILSQIGGAIEVLNTRDKTPPTNEAEEREVTEALRCINNLNSIKSDMAKRLGERTLNPVTHLFRKKGG